MFLTIKFLPLSPGYCIIKVTAQAGVRGGACPLCVRPWISHQHSHCMYRHQETEQSSESVKPVQIFFEGGSTSGDAQDLLRNLHIEIIPGNAWGTVWDVGDRTRVGCLQSKQPIPCPIFPALETNINLTTSPKH